jgi:hypothetical protein
MVPWDKLPKDVQKTILALIVISGGSAATSCRPPVVYDPPPPPKTAPPSLTRTPIICDAMPLPSATPRRTATPVVCDPPPPPATRSPQATRTAEVGLKFRLRSLQMTSDPTLPGAAIRGTVYDKQGQPLEGIKVTVRTPSTVIDTVTARNGSFFLRVPEPGAWQLVIGDDTSSALPLQLKQYDVANVEWAEIGSASQAPLPLAEIRTVDILWGDDLTFQVETPWPGARCRWSVTGGSLVGRDEQVTWEPPGEPGRYLLQLVADWGYEGLAVDSLVLTVNRDGSIYIS